MVRLIEPCYLELEEIKNEIKNQKEKDGQPSKTTFSETVYMLIKYYRDTKAII